MNTVPFPSERVIEDYLWEVLTATKVCPITGCKVASSYRQLEIKGYGITDLVIVTESSSSITVRVIELKNETLKEAHLSQLARYMTGLDRYLEKYSEMAARSGRVLYIRGVLAGPFDLRSSGDFPYLLNQIHNIDAYSLSLTLEEGFECSCLSDQGWHRKNEDPSSIRPYVCETLDAIAARTRDRKEDPGKNVFTIGRALN